MKYFFIRFYILLKKNFLQTGYSHWDVIIRQDIKNLKSLEFGVVIIKVGYLTMTEKNEFYLIYITFFYLLSYLQIR